MAKNPSRKSTVPTPSGDDGVLRRVHEAIVRIRVTERALVQAVHAGAPFAGPVYPALGQEAVTACSVLQLEKDDWICPTPREAGALLLRGMDIRDWLAAYADTDAGPARGHSGGGRFGSALHAATPSIGSTASNLAVGSGIALSFQVRGKRNVVVGFFGDGVMNTGTWHEVANWVSVQKLPMVLVCNNNGVALGTTVHESSPVDGLGQRAEGYGMPWVSVDGTDVEGAWKALGEAVARARAGGGGTLVELVTPRLGGFSSDDEQVNVPRAVDVLARLESRLVAQGLMTAAEITAVHQRAAEQADKAMNAVRQMPRAQQRGA